MRLRVFRSAGRSTECLNWRMARKTRLTALRALNANDRFLFVLRRDCFWHPSACFNRIDKTVASGPAQRRRSERHAFAKVAPVSLYTSTGERKYLTRAERVRFHRGRKMLPPGANSERSA